MCGSPMRRWHEEVGQQVVGRHRAGDPRAGERYMSGQRLLSERPSLEAGLLCGRLHFQRHDLLLKRRSPSTNRITYARTACTGEGGRLCCKKKTDLLE